MEEIDREVLATITEDVLSPELADRVITEAKRMFDASRRPGHEDRLRRELASIEREQARVTEAIAVSGERILILIERLGDTVTKRRDLAAQLDAAAGAAAPSWTEIERRMRLRLKDWRSTLTGDVARVREAFRQGLLTTPILFTPFVENGYRAIRFEGRWGMGAVFGAELVMPFLRQG